jgi:hypothetical protein
MLIGNLMQSYNLQAKSSLPGKNAQLVPGMYVYMFLHRSTLFFVVHMGYICPPKAEIAPPKNVCLTPDHLNLKFPLGDLNRPKEGPVSSLFACKFM